MVGGYAFTWGVVALGMTVLVALGVDYHEAEMAMMLLAFLVFLTVFLWAFAAESMLRVWALLAGGAVVMILAASTLQASLIG
ncbi:iron uptake protein [Permianibacter aggregans]|nr:iron uptake protein [Permianibacter aggregans]